MTLPPAIQPLRCQREACTFPQGGRCAREAEFAEPLTQCTELARSEDATPSPTPKRVSSPPPPPTAPVPPGDPTPWSGRHLPLEEARRLLFRTPARLIAVLGVYDAGKTSLLASFFLQIANGQRPALPYRFAGSRSLYGFRDLIEKAVRYSGKKGDLTVDHSPTEESQDIGRLLHIGFRPEDERDNRLVDVLFTDLPGEWMRDWAQVDDETLDRRMPLLRRASGVVVVADAESLLATGGGTSDSVTAQFIRRVATVPSHGQKPGLSLVLSKMDRVLDRVTPPTQDAAHERAAWGPLGKRLRATWPALEGAKSKGFDVKVFPSTAFPSALDKGQPINVVQPFAHVIQCADRREPWPRLVPDIPPNATPFQCLRRREAWT